MKKIREFENRTDEEIARLVPGNRELFGIIIRRYQDKIARYIRRIGGGTKESVEDVVQNIFIKAYVNIKSFREEKKFSSWLYGIAHNECIDYWRRNRKHAGSVSLDDNTELASVLASTDNIEERMFRKEEEERVRKILDLLPIKFKEVLILRYLEDKEYQEISDILKKPVPTVGTLLHRAKSKLRKLLTEE